MSAATSLSSILDELDHAISVNLQGLTGEQQPSSDDSSIFDLRAQFSEQLQLHGDCDLSAIKLDWTSSPVPLPGWVPKIISDNADRLRGTG